MATYDPWTDVDRTPIPYLCRIEQVDVDGVHGALRSRLHRQAQVLGRTRSRLIVRFDGEAREVTIRPHLVRLLREAAS